MSTEKLQRLVDEGKVCTEYLNWWLGVSGPGYEFRKNIGNENTVPSKDIYSEVTKSMQEDDYYSNHTREECKKEWRKRYEKLKL